MRWSIRAKLTAIVLAVLVPLVAGALFKFWLEQRDSRERAQERMLVTAQAVDATPGRAPRRADRESRGAGRRWCAPAHGQRRARHAHPPHPHHPSVRARVLRRVAGRLGAGAEPPARAAAARAGDPMRAVREAARTGRPQVSAPGPSLLDGQPVIALAIAVQEPGAAPRAALVEELELPGFSSYLDGLPSARAGISIVTPDGRLVAGVGGGRRRRRRARGGAEPGSGAPGGRRRPLAHADRAQLSPGSGAACARAMGGRGLDLQRRGGRPRRRDGSARISSGSPWPPPSACSRRWRSAGGCAPPSPR